MINVYLQFLFKAPMAPERSVTSVAPSTSKTGANLQPYQNKILGDLYMTMKQWRNLRFSFQQLHHQDQMASLLDVLVLEHIYSLAH